MSKIGGSSPTPTTPTTGQSQAAQGAGQSAEQNQEEKTGAKIFNGWIKGDSYEAGNSAPPTGGAAPEGASGLPSPGSAAPQRTSRMRIPVNQRFSIKARYS